MPIDPRSARSKPFGHILTGLTEADAADGEGGLRSRFPMATTIQGGHPGRPLILTAP